MTEQAGITGKEDRRLGFHRMQLLSLLPSLPPSEGGDADRPSISTCSSQPAGKGFCFYCSAVSPSFGLATRPRSSNLNGMDGRPATH